MNKKLAKKVKELRTANKWTKKELADKTNLTEAAINNIEAGRRQIYADDLKEFCRAFHITAESFFEDNKPLSILEARLLVSFNRLSEPYQNIIMNIIEDLLKVEKSQVTLILPMIEETQMRSNITTLDYYPQAAGMGNGQYVKDAIPEKISVPTDKIPPKTDFIIKVVGDSMEPTFHSGDKLFIQSTSYLEEGDIGVFNIDGEQVVKEAGNGELISHNKKYSPIKTDHCHLTIQGKVLGKLEE